AASSRSPRHLRPRSPRSSPSGWPERTLHAGPTGRGRSTSRSTTRSTTSTLTGSTRVRLSELGEFGLLGELERRGLVADIADDAALLRGGLVVTQDALVESVHFRLDWTSWRDLGYKAAAVNLSDLAASGAEPEGL